jgi:hypothetical protein
MFRRVLGHAVVVLLVVELAIFPYDASVDSTWTQVTTHVTVASRRVTAADSHPLSTVADHHASQPFVSNGDIDDDTDAGDDDFAVATVLVAQMPPLRAPVSQRGAAPRLRQPITLSEPPPDPPPTSAG